MPHVFEHNAFWSSVNTQISKCAAAPATAAFIASLAHTAMLMEVSSTPKPGLVCPDHNGSHTDMDYALFVTSAKSLIPYLRACADIGEKHCREKADSIMALLRQAGIQAEKDMFAATRGVNTHKGMVFSMGLVVAAAGRLFGRGEVLRPEDVVAEAAAFVQGIVARDLLPLREKLPERRLTAGEKLFLEHGIAGIRQEAEEGFPAALEAYRSLRTLFASGVSLDAALPHVLLEIMAATDDTNIIWRGGMAGLKHAHSSAVEALQKGGMLRHEGREFIMLMRDDFVRRNLSPGGSADLLAMAAFFLFLDKIG